MVSRGASTRLPLRGLALSLSVSALSIACRGSARPARHVEPLQLFGAEPDLMPALGFESMAGVLTVSARYAVFVTVLEIDPTTQSREVVFPEPGATPRRVSGQRTLQLALRRHAPLLPARGVLVIASADSLSVPQAREGAAQWAIPEVMPGQWAAVYVWVPPRIAAGGRVR